ncbi:hypothetical protein [Quadrisphaera granulorum]|nr:hypothetical protein [Quadrisphaera granulorum]
MDMSDHGDMDHGGMDHGDMDMSDHGDMDMSDHGDMDHGGMDMSDHGDMDMSDHGDMDMSDHGDMDMSDHGDMDMSDHGDMDMSDHGDMDMSDHGDMDHDGMDMSDHGDMDHGGMDMSDHGGMDMSGPGGIALASGGEDRDGLEMDVLHVQLGPVLGLWPSGLVVTVTLQGDVVVDAHAHHLDEAAAPERVDARVAACERAARILALAGSRYAAAAVRLRDALQMGTEVGSADTGRQIDLDGELAGLLARVQRSRTLRWSLRGLGDLKDDQIEKAGLPAGDQGDVHDRLIASLRLAADPVAAAPTSYGHRHRAVEALPSLLIGRELAEVRLTVASLDLESRGVFPEPEHGPDAGGADAAGGAVAAEAVA